MPLLTLAIGFAASGSIPGVPRGRLGNLVFVLGMAALSWPIWSFCREAATIPSDLATQWDFDIYYAAVHNWIDGYAVYENGNRFFYLPLTLSWILPLAHLDPLAAHQVFFGIKIVLLFGLIVLWQFVFIKNRFGLLLLLLFVCFAFAGSVSTDLLTGNVSVFESALVWSAFAFYRNDRPLPFILLISLASFYKVWPIVFLGLLFFKADWKPVLASVCAVSGFLWINHRQFQNVAVFRFDAYREGIGNLFEERAPSAPSFFPFIKDVIDRISPELARNMPTVDIWAYGAAVFALCVAMVVVLKPMTARLSRQDVVLLAVLSAPFISPRFKDYTFLMLIPAAVVVVMSAVRTWPARVAVSTLVCTSLWKYQPLLSAFVLQGLFLAHLRRRAPIPAAKAQLPVTS